MINFNKHACMQAYRSRDMMISNNIPHTVTYIIDYTCCLFSTSTWWLQPRPLKSTKYQAKTLSKPMGRKSCACRQVHVILLWGITFMVKDVKARRWNSGAPENSRAPPCPSEELNEAIRLHREAKNNFPMDGLGKSST